MDEGLPSVSIFAFFVVLVINVFIHGFGIGLEHVSKEEIEKKSSEKKDSISSKLLLILDNSVNHIEETQILTIIINMVLGFFVVYRAGNYICNILGLTEGGLISIVPYLLTGLVVILLIMSFGIMIPRRLAARSPEKWTYACFYPSRFLATVLFPVFVIAKGVAQGVLYVFGVRVDDKVFDVTEEEIKSMVTEGQEQGVLQESEADMISNIFEFSDKEAQDIMTNRNAMVAIDANTSLKDAVSFMIDTNNSRFPVYLEDIDHIIGIMHIRDAMKKLNADTDEELPIRKIKGLLRQPKFVPETRNIDSLFHSMQSSKTQMVIVIDEYGQTAGLVSMEDILEEIVGEILDEHDSEIASFKKLGDGSFEFAGDMMIEKVLSMLGVEDDSIVHESNTLSGWILEILGEIPSVGKKFSRDGLCVEVLASDTKKVSKAKVSLEKAEAVS